jgi:branched-chain amino acid transport system permease protein
MRRLLKSPGFRITGPPLVFTLTGLALTQVLDLYQEVTLTTWLIYGLLALSLALVWGQGGIFSFGQTAFFGLAAYGFGAISINLESHSGETLTALIGATLMAGVFAAALGYFMFYGRVSDVYVAIITLAVTLVLLAVFSSTSGPQYRVGAALFGGYNGMAGIPPLELRLPRLTSIQLDNSLTYILVVSLCGLVYLVVKLLMARPFGRAVLAVSDNETRSELLGYDFRRLKLLVFTLGGVIAGLAGALYAGSGNFVNPDPFTLFVAAQTIIWVMVGGRTSLVGAFAGAITISALSDYLGGKLATGTPLVLGAILIAIVLLLPRGLIPTLQAVLPWPGPPLRRGVDPVDTDPHSAPADLPTETTQPQQLGVKDLTKRFGGVAAVDNVSISFPPRRLHAIIGPNGAGKSTLFNLLVGRYRPNSGTVLHDSEDITRLAPYQRARRGLGIKLQVPAIYRSLSVSENIWLAAFARLHHVRQAEGIVTAVLERLGLVQVAGSPAGELAHGDQQWLEIGMILASAPETVLLDEPTAGMTREDTLRMVDLVRELAQQATVVVVEHDMEFVAQLDAPVTMLHQGRVFASGSYQELRENPAVLDVYLGRAAHATC